MNLPNVDSFKPNLFHENLSAAIGSANHEVGGQGEEQGASCGEKKSCDQAAVDGEVPEHLDQSHLEIYNERHCKDIFPPPFLLFILNIITAGELNCCAVQWQLRLKGSRSWRWKTTLMRRKNCQNLKKGKGTRTQRPDLWIFSHLKKTSQVQCHTENALNMR